MINARSIINKFALFNYFVSLNNFDCIFITESWSRVDIGEGELSIPHYQLFRADRSTRRGGGTAIYVRDNLQAIPIEDINVEYEDIVGCRIGLSDGKALSVVCAYRADSNSAIQNRALLTTIRRFCIGCDQLLLVGDFNYREIKWDTFVWPHKCDDFMETILDCNLVQRVGDPTRGDSILDLIFSSDEDLVSNVSIREGLGTSDHNSVFFDLLCFAKSHRRRADLFDWNRAKWDKVVPFLKFALADLVDFESVDEMWHTFKYAFEDCKNLFVPKKALSTKRRKPVWADNAAHRAIKRQQNAHRSYLRLRTGRSYENYRVASEMATIEVNRSVARFERFVASNAKSDPKTFWSYVNSKRKAGNNIGPVKRPNGSLTSSDFETAEVFSDFFASVFSSESFVNFPFVARRGDEVIHEVCFTEALLREEIAKLPLRSSPGFDSIANPFLIRAVDAVALPLSLLFSKSFQQGNLAKDWKSAIVCPLLKSGPKNSTSNFRPVSLTSCVCKLMERILRSSIVEHLSVNRLLNLSQFGFMESRSCELQLVKYLDFLTSIIDQGDSADSVYLDFQKAFDRVPHRRLLEKLSAYGIVGKHLAWLSDFVLGRVQQVKVNGSLSRPRPVDSGVAQGSVLGPVLFIIYIDDIDESVSGNIFKFADDSKICRRILRSAPDLGIDGMAGDLSSVMDWSRKWGMSFNLSKFACLHFGRSNPESTYNVEEIVIPNANVHGVKDIGVWISPDLKSSLHVGAIVRKAQSMLGFVFRSFRYLDAEGYLALYYAFVRSTLEFASCAWNPHLRKDINLIESVQRRFTRRIPGLRGLSYEERLRLLGINSLETRRHRADLILTYKIIHGLVKFDMGDLFDFAPDAGTRGHYLKLKIKDIARLDVRKYSFAHRVVEPWNRLLVGVVSAPSPQSFKTRLHDSGALGL